MQSSTEYVTEFLSRWGLHPTDLLGHIRPMQPSESVLVVGSIADGLANELSDIDLLVIGDGELADGFIQREATSEESVVRLPRGQEVNLEYWNTRNMEDLRERMRPNFELLKNPVPNGWFTKLNDSELRLLHRLRTGMVLTNPEIASYWREQLQLEVLPVYLLLQGVGMHFAYREDAIAQNKYEHDVYSTLIMLRLAAENMAYAMVASVGESLPARKWLTRLLRRNQSVLGERQVNELLSYFFPNPHDNVTALIHKAIDFFDTVIGECLERCPDALPVMLQLSGEVSFVTSLEGAPKAAAPATSA